MKALSFAAIAKAVHITADPDVFGPNGKNYENNNANMEFSRIQIDIEPATHGNTEKCQAGDWATVHWSGSLKDGRMVTDSRSEPGGQPKTFAVGASEVNQCWDLGI